MAGGADHNVAYGPRGALVLRLGGNLLRSSSETLPKALEFSEPYHHYFQRKSLRVGKAQQTKPGKHFANVLWVPT